MKLYFVSFAVTFFLTAKTQSFRKERKGQFHAAYRLQRIDEITGVCSEAGNKSLWRHRLCMELK